MNITLVEEAAEKYGLENPVTLDEILERFIRETSDFEFPELDDQSQEDTASKRRKILEGIRNLVGEVPLTCEREDIEKAKRGLLAEYLLSMFNGKYKVIDPKLFELRRRVRLEDDPEEDVAIPLFANVEVGNREWEPTLTYHSRKIYLRARTPPLSREAIKKAKEVMADYHVVCAETLREPVIGTLLFNDLYLHRGDWAKLRLHVSWIPSDLEIHETPKDPILTANFYNKYLLVATWNVENELSFEHYIREFTS